MAVSVSWDDSGDDRSPRMSFEDSDRFEEDSLCSLGSENEMEGILTWRGWRRSGSGLPGSPVEFATTTSTVRSLSEICADVVGVHYAFEVVEQSRPPVPEQLQLRIAFYAFPKHEDDIRLYSCLANGTMSEFQKGEQFVKHKAVTNVLQIGFHLSGRVVQPQSYNQSHSVSISFDRGKIISCWCTCQSSIVWCAHVIAVCLLRIQFPGQVTLRAPVSESLSRLAKDQLQKFAQYLINELPQQILPTAQKLLDELLSTESSEINKLEGAPDPTAGALIGSVSNWCLDDETLRLNIRKILGRFSGPAPVVFVDIGNLCYTSGAPPAALEWTNLIRPLRKKEPEGLWNLLSIVRDLLKSFDPNSTRILEVLTEECLAWPQLIMWWLSSENEDILRHSGRGRHNTHRNNTLPTSDNAKYTSVRLLDEHVNLWKFVAMDPCLVSDQRKHLRTKLETWHNNAVLIGQKGLAIDVASLQIVNERFKGFKPAIEACNINWMDMYQSLGFSLNDFTERKKGKDIPSGITSSTLISANTFDEFIEHSTQVELNNLFSCTKALYTHGYQRAARSLSSRLAMVLMKFLDNHSGDLSSLHLSKMTSLPPIIAFITEILLEDPSYVSLAFQLALLGLTMPRGPAATKLQEVRLVDKEIALHAAIKSIPLSSVKIDTIRNKSQLILNGKLSRGNMSLPLLFVLYAFEVLANAELVATYLARQKVMLVKEDNLIKEEDHILAYKLALHVLELKSQASEKKHAMICEGHRRFRSDLVFTLLWHYRDCEDKIREILDILLDHDRYDIIVFERPIDLKQEEVTRDTIMVEQSPSGSKSRFSGVKTGSPDETTVVLKNWLHSVSSDSSDSGNGGGGKEKSNCWRLPKQLISSGTGTGLRRSPKNKYSKSSKPSRNKRQLKRQRSREYTESDSDSQYSLRGVTSQHGASGLEDWDTDTTGDRGPVDSGSGQMLENINVTSPNTISQPAGVQQSTEEIVHRSSLGRTTEEEQSLVDNSENKLDAVDQSSDEDRLSLSSFNDESLGEDIKHQCVFSGESSSCLCCLEEKQLDLQDRYSSRKVDSEDSLAPFDEKERSSFLSEASFDNREHSRDDSITGKPDGYKQRCLDYREDTTNKGATVAFEGAVNSSEELIESQVTADDKLEEAAPRVSELSVMLEELHYPTNNETEESIISNDTNESINRDGQPDLGQSNTSTIQQSSIDYSDPQEGEYETDAVCSESLSLSSSFLQNTTTPNEKRSTHNENPLTPFTTRELAITGHNDSSISKRRKARGTCRPRPLDVRHVAADSFMLFELAKRVLNQSYGQDTLCLVIEDSNEMSRFSSRHRGLQLAAFEIGLFALGINNLVTPNWMSRTYSSNVTWVTNEAIDLGTPALRLINENWDGILTPSEVIAIASSAARSAEASLGRIAAELALSCLPQANSLTPHEVEQAIFLCFDQDSEMLERACASIESASRNGGVQPELLFQIARQWHYIHEKLRDNGHDSRIPNQNKSFPAQSDFQHAEKPGEASGIAQPRNEAHPPVNVPSNGQHSVILITPQQFVQEQMHQQVQEIINRQNGLRWNSLPRNCQQSSASWMYNSHGSMFYRSTFASTPMGRGMPQACRIPTPQPAPRSNDVWSFDTPPYLQNAYRVGMKALEGLAARMPDERPESKFVPSPPCSDDIRWLCALAASISPGHLRHFCSVVVGAVSSPFLLHDLALESARHFALYNPAQLASHLRSPSVSPIVLKCLSIYTELIRHELGLLNHNGYDSFVELLRKTRSAFCMSPGGMAKFNDLLQMIRKAHPRKKELWHLIMVGLSRA